MMIPRKSLVYKPVTVNNNVDASKNINVTKNNQITTIVMVTRTSTHQQAGQRSTSR